MKVVPIHKCEITNRCTCENYDIDTGESTPSEWCYGHLDYLVSPIAGSGETWHQSDQITFNDVTTERIEG